MKKIILALLLAISIQTTFSQTATSVQNGAWLSPSTWNCGCIPIMNYSVVINHTVTLNTSMSFTSATSGLYIGSNGALLQDANRDILINGGSFYNSGVFDVRYFYTESGSSAMNDSKMTLSAFTNSVDFTNNGIITVDSITNLSDFTNHGTLNADSLTNMTIGPNTAVLTSDGNLNVSWSRNYGSIQNSGRFKGIAHTNNGYFFHGGADSLTLTAGLWNTNYFFLGLGYIRLGGSFYNTDPTANKAVFYIEGNVTVLGSWYNTDTIDGSTHSGHFSVQDSSVNTGYMKGNFDFCDHTQVTPGEIVDYNTGSISPNITTCGQVGIEKYSNETRFSIYPNPTNSILNINVSSSSEAYRELNVYDVLGKSILKSELKNQNNTIDVSSLPSGMYYLKIGNTTQKFVKE